MEIYKRFFFIFFIFLILTSKSFSSSLDKEVCNIFNNVYESCKKNLNSIPFEKKALICNELSLNTAFYFDNFLKNKSSKSKNLSKLIGKVCFEGCIGEEKIYNYIKTVFCDTK